MTEHTLNINHHPFPEAYIQRRGLDVAGGQQIHTTFPISHWEGWPIKRTCSPMDACLRGLVMQVTGCLKVDWLFSKDFDMWRPSSRNYPNTSLLPMLVNIRSSLGCHVKCCCWIKTGKPTPFCMWTQTSLGQIYNHNTMLRKSQWKEYLRHAKRPRL